MWVTDPINNLNLIYLVFINHLSQRLIYMNYGGTSISVMEDGRVPNFLRGRQFRFLKFRSL